MSHHTASQYNVEQASCLPKHGVVYIVFVCFLQYLTLQSLKKNKRSIHFDIQVFDILTWRQNICRGCSEAIASFLSLP